MSSFTKVFKTTTQKFKEYCNIMIKNDSPFSVYNTEISTNQNDELIYPTNDELTEYLSTVYQKDFKVKQLPEKALENMRKKGITPKKQPAELILIFISANTTNVHYSISIPHSFNDKIDDYERFMGDLSFTKVDGDTTVLYGNKVCEFPIKEKDAVQSMFFESLKEFGIYEDDESDDEMEFNLNDI